jgi:hypothetical protein
MVPSFTRPEECNLPNDFGRTQVLSVQSSGLRQHRLNLASNVWGGGGKTEHVY